MNLLEYMNISVFGAKSSLTYANYALKRGELDNEEMYPIAAKARQK